MKPPQAAVLRHAIGNAAEYIRGEAGNLSIKLLEFLKLQVCGMRSAMC